MHVLGCVEYSVFCVRVHEFHERRLWEGCVDVVLSVRAFFFLFLILRFIYA